MAKMRKFEIEDEHRKALGKKPKNKIEQIDNDDGTITIKHDDNVVEYNDPNHTHELGPPFPGATKYCLSNPCYWYRDSQGIWHRYCW
jgi:hypothetical protein